MEQPTLEQMKAERDELEESIASMKGQIAKAKAERHRTGTFADTAWWAKVNSAKTHASQRLQKLNRDIAAAERARRQATGGSFAARFVEAAKRRLKPEVFKAISEDANEIPAAQEVAGSH